jgi:hypothetical protein
MIKRILMKLEQGEGYLAVGLWPIEPQVLPGIVDHIPVETKVFVAVDDMCSPEGFHPPAAHDLNLLTTLDSGIAQCSFNTLKTRLADTERISRTVDVLFYCPSVEVDNLKALAEAFREFKYGQALSKWGGYWLYLHDSEDLHFFVAPKPQAMKRMLHAVFHSIPEDERPDMVNETADLLASAKEAEIVDLIFFRHKYHLKLTDRLMWWNWESLFQIDRKAVSQ